MTLYELNNDIKLRNHGAAHFIRGEVTTQHIGTLYCYELSTFLVEVTASQTTRTDDVCSFCIQQLATALRRGPYQSNLLLAGYDEQEGVSLYQMDYMASLSKVNFGAHGYAANFILSVFDRDWKKGMDLQQALEVVRRCIHELKTRFLISQPVFILKVVDQSGTRTITL